MARAAISLAVGFIAIVPCNSRRVDAPDVSAHIVEVYENVLKKNNVRNERWDCEEETCSSLPCKNEKQNTTCLLWSCTTPAEKATSQGSSSCSEEGSTRTVGKELFRSSVEAFVAKGQKVKFLLPAFPYKSRNHKLKTSGELPDMGEALAVARLGNFCEQIERIYQPGCVVIIVSDGRVFNDVAGVSDCALEAYTRTMKGFIRHYGKNHVQWKGLDTLLTDEDLEVDDMKDGESEVPRPIRVRRRLEAFLEKEDWEVDKKIKTDPDYLALYRGFMKFKKGDFADLFGEKDENGKRKGFKSKKFEIKFLETIAKKQMLRNQAYNRLLENRQPCGEIQCVRLSIHAHANDVKFGVNLVGTGGESNDWPTPWHSVVSMPSDFQLQNTNDKFPEVTDVDGNLVNIIALENRGEAEEKGCAVVSASVIAPESYTTREMNEGSVADAKYDEKKTCEDQDHQMPFWLCTAVKFGYSGSAKYEVCDAETVQDQLVGVSRPFFFQETGGFRTDATIDA